MHAAASPLTGRHPHAGRSALRYAAIKSMRKINNIRKHEEKIL